MRIFELCKRMECGQKYGQVQKQAQQNLAEFEPILGNLKKMDIKNITIFVSASFVNYIVISM